MDLPTAEHPADGGSEVPLHPSIIKKKGQRSALKTIGGSIKNNAAQLETARSCPSLFHTRGASSAAESTLRVYGGDVVPSVDGTKYKGISISPATTSLQVIRMALQRFGISDTAEQYELRYIRLKNTEKSNWRGVFRRDKQKHQYQLLPHECPFEVASKFDEQRRFQLFRANPRTQSYGAILQEQAPVIIKACTIEPSIRSNPSEKSVESTNALERIDENSSGQFSTPSLVVTGAALSISVPTTSRELSSNRILSTSDLSDNKGTELSNVSRGSSSRIEPVGTIIDIVPQRDQDASPLQGKGEANSPELHLCRFETGNSDGRPPPPPAPSYPSKHEILSTGEVPSNRQGSVFPFLVRLTLDNSANTTSSTSKIDLSSSASMTVGKAHDGRLVFSENNDVMSSEYCKLVLLGCDIAVAPSQISSVFVDGVKVETPMTLCNNAIIRFGDADEHQYRVVGACSRQTVPLEEAAVNELFPSHMNPKSADGKVNEATIADLSQIAYRPNSTSLSVNHVSECETSKSLIGARTSTPMPTVGPSDSKGASSDDQIIQHEQIAMPHSQPPASNPFPGTHSFNTQSMQYTPSVMAGSYSGSSATNFGGQNGVQFGPSLQMNWPRTNVAPLPMMQNNVMFQSPANMMPQPAHAVCGPSLLGPYVSNIRTNMIPQVMTEPTFGMSGDVAATIEYFTQTIQQFLIQKAQLPGVANKRKRQKLNSKIEVLTKKREALILQQQQQRPHHHYHHQHHQMHMQPIPQMQRQFISNHFPIHRHFQQRINPNQFQQAQQFHRQQIQYRMPTSLPNQAPQNNGYFMQSDFIQPVQTPQKVNTVQEEKNPAQRSFGSMLNIEAPEFLPIHMASTEKIDDSGVSIVVVSPSREPSLVHAIDDENQSSSQDQLSDRGRASVDEPSVEPELPNIGTASLVDDSIVEGSADSQNLSAATPTKKPSPVEPPYTLGKLIEHENQIPSPNSSEMENGNEEMNESVIIDDLNNGQPRSWNDVVASPSPSKTKKGSKSRRYSPSGQIGSYAVLASKSSRSSHSPVLSKSSKLVPKNARQRLEAPVGRMSPLSKQSKSRFKQNKVERTAVKTISHETTDKENPATVKVGTPKALPKHVKQKKYSSATSGRPTQQGINSFSVSLRPTGIKLTDTPKAGSKTRYQDSPGGVVEAPLDLIGRGLRATGRLKEGKIINESSVEIVRPDSRAEEKDFSEKRAMWL